MFGKILFILISFLLFLYIFVFKLIRKNDTIYLVILITQAIGMLINLVEIMFNVLNSGFWKFVVYLTSIVLPIIILILELKKFNFSEIMHISISKILLYFEKQEKARDVLIRLVSKYNESYHGHKLLAEIYKSNGEKTNAIDEYVKVLDIRKNDYKSYFEISKLLNELNKKDESIEMLTILLKGKPGLYEPCKMLGDLLMEREDFRQAINVYIEGIKHNQTKADLFYDLGVAYTMMNEFTLAKRCYEKACELNCNLYNSYYRLGQISLLYKDIELAEKYFLQSMYGDTESKSYYQLSKIYLIKNDKNKATMFINRAIDKNNKYYKLVEEEPIFLPINKMIMKPKSDLKLDFDEETEKERKISEYLDNTYSLTKVLDRRKANRINNTNK